MAGLRQRAAFVALLVTLVAGCSRGAELPTGGGSGSGSAEVPVDEQTIMAQSMPPVVVASAQRCKTDAECRLHQPSDWSAEVECCYTYGCDLKYEAVNLTSWELLKRWRAAHAFDCVAHLAKSGPCATTSAVCGLSQEPPPAVCAAGLCSVAIPEAWPKVDGSAQRCDVDGDCRAIGEPSSKPEAVCCGGGCGGPWVAVNRATQEELDRWLAGQKSACADKVVCAAAAACGASPAAVCTGGLCAMAPAP